MDAALTRKLVAEFTGTAFLLASIVGSGVMAERLSDDPGLQLLQNAIATAGVLTAMILAFGSVSGAHFNPVVTIVDRFFGGLSTLEAGWYVGAQLAGGVVGVLVTNLMFDLPAVAISTTERSGFHMWLAETVATLGLLAVIFGLVRARRASVVAFGVGSYIAGVYYFTSSTGFANPAVTVGRMLSDTFAGIQPASVPAFLLAQLAGAALAVALIRSLFTDVERFADRVVVPHEVG